MATDSPGFMHRLVRNALILLLLLAAGGCYMRDVRWSALQPPASRGPGREYTVITTGYCPCGACCGWHRNWLGRPVISHGPNRGKAKAVGVTASGTKARPGTLAADTSIFPFGTIIEIPGYGFGRVEDRGGDIKGMHLDLFYRSHGQALQHGRIRQKVRVWFPPGYRPTR